MLLETMLALRLLLQLTGGVRVEARLDQRLHKILEDTRQRYQLYSLLLADHHGLPVSHAGEIVHTGMAAIAPELIRVGEHARRLGEYDSINCVALVLEDAHLMVIRDIELGGKPFVLVMDTATVPKGLLHLIKDLTKRLTDAMDMVR